ncbi:DUF2889 domain-containing protein [Bradyrhizobium brasilense]|uniref:DUF2889 domain-containing protein n=1 Tax=Bradyrhizobium brasilense TaxID=1419277 RepID=UPI0024B17DB1|nr:DUF2889 domain-containing protein [Bradyrhizobium australafricanum]WFU31330.1 DUF2889 domain-containing protein [Bradyrhizobium australafricanum]
MPLSAPVEREMLHRRVIEVVGYHRRDLLWDLEARLIDSKTNAYANPWREVLPGEAMHDMSLRLTVDTSFRICAVDVVSDSNPYPPCSEAAGAFAPLVGLTIGPGWKRNVRERIPQTVGCTHLYELIGSVGSVMFQTILPVLQQQGAFDRRPRPGLIDSCCAYRMGSDVVRHLWPDLPIR